LVKSPLSRLLLFLLLLGVLRLSGAPWAAWTASSQGPSDARVALPPLFLPAPHPQVGKQKPKDFQHQRQPGQALTHCAPPRLPSALRCSRKPLPNGYTHTLLRGACGRCCFSWRVRPVVCPTCCQLAAR